MQTLTNEWHRLALQRPFLPTALPRQSPKNGYSNSAYEVNSRRSTLGIQELGVFSLILLAQIMAAILAFFHP